MSKLTSRQIELLRSKWVTRASFHTNGVTFDCLEGEWFVSVKGQRVDVFSFSRYNKKEFAQVIDDIFYDTEKVTFQ